MTNVESTRYIVAMRANRFRAMAIALGVSLQDAHAELMKIFEAGQDHMAAETIEQLFDAIKVIHTQQPPLKVVRYSARAPKPLTLPFFGNRVVSVGGYVCIESEADTTRGWMNYLNGVSALQPQQQPPAIVIQYAEEMNITIPALITPVIEVDSLLPYPSVAAEPKVTEQHGNSMTNIPMEATPAREQPDLEVVVLNKDLGIEEGDVRMKSVELYVELKDTDPAQAAVDAASEVMQEDTLPSQGSHVRSSTLSVNKDNPAGNMQL